MGRSAAVLAMAFLLVVGRVCASPRDIAEGLRLQLESGETAASVSGGERLYRRELLTRFYEARAFKPVWENRTAQAMLTAIRASRDQGLDPGSYHLTSLQAFLEDGSNRSIPSAVRLELLLSDALLTLASDYASGRVDPQALDNELAPSQRPDSGADALARVAEGQPPPDVLRRLLPSSSQYGVLRTQLAHFRRLASEGAWPRIDVGPAMRVGGAGPRVKRLLDRLRAEGYAVGKGGFFTLAAESAVKAFQASHGLKPDGVVGRGTLAAMNLRPEDIVQILRANMERWRWLPDDLGQNHVFVNIADYRVDLVLDGKRVRSYAAVVGRSYFRTPVFSNRIRYLVLDPTWEVPPSIAEDEILPAIREDRDYLQRMGLRVLSGWGADAREVDPGTIDWSGLGPRNFPYRLQQQPGPDNSLGRVKFMFPNAFNVYLHDSPAKSLFDRSARAFSHGCIRVEDALDLARRVLVAGGRPDVARDLDARLESGQEKTVVLKEPIPIQIVYLTAFVDGDGTLQLRPDIYSRDQRILAALADRR